MRKSRWKESEIKDMLRELPKLKDDRTKAEVFAGIHDKKRKKHWMPLIAGVTSLFLLVAFASSLIIGKKELQVKRRPAVMGNFPFLKIRK